MSDCILVVEDERSIRTIVEYALRDAGFRVVTAARGDDALDVVAAEPVDLVVLDIMLPGLDGLEVCKRIRAERNIPIIMLSARGEELDKVLGLELGADDYVTKPFSPRELVSRVKANLRRARLEPDRTAPLRVGDLEIDATARTVRRAGEEIPLTYSEFEILHKLAGSPRRVFTREELMNHLWKGNFYGDLRSVDVHVRHLRQKVEHEPSAAGAHPHRARGGLRLRRGGREGAVRARRALGLQGWLVAALLAVGLAASLAVLLVVLPTLESSVRTDRAKREAQELRAAARARRPAGPALRRDLGSAGAAAGGRRGRRHRRRGRGSSTRTRSTSSEHAA